jgi:hypothetical protein
MSDEYDSDASLNTEDLNEINNIDTQTYEEVPIKSVERTKQTKRVLVPNQQVDETEIVVETKQTPKKARTEKQIANIANLVKRNKERAEARKKARAEGKLIDEKPLGRKPKPKPPKEEIVINREVQKIIYMIPDGQGGFEKHLNKPRITKKDIQYQKNVMESEQEELVIGKVLLKKKNGKLDNRSNKTRTPAQIKATEKLIANAKKRRMDVKKTKAEVETSKMEQINDTIHNTIVDVVKTPASQIKKRAIQPRPVITDEDRHLAQAKKVNDLFS